MIRNKALPGFPNDRFQLNGSDAAIATPVVTDLTKIAIRNSNSFTIKNIDQLFECYIKNPKGEKLKNGNLGV